MISDDPIRDLSGFADSDVKMPALFVGHGSPMNAIDDNLGQELRPLRRKGVLIVGSGNAVHNLGILAWQDVAYDWALEFDDKVKQLILAGDHRALVRYDQLGRAAQLAVPTNEHYLPLLYALAVQDPGDEISFFADKVTMGSVSMRSLRIG